MRVDLAQVLDERDREAVEVRERQAEAHVGAAERDERQGDRESR